LNPPGKTIDAELTSVQADAKRSSRRQPTKPVPRLEIVADPVMRTDSASAVPTSVVLAAAMDAEASALVLRRMANPARR
jgi:hypothetical protein